MKRIRSFLPRVIPFLGIVSAAVVGITVATAQNQPYPKPAQPNTTKPAQEQAAPTKPDAQRPAERQPNARQEDRPDAQGERAAPRSDRAEAAKAAALGVQFQAQGDQGLTVTTIEQNSALRQAGLRQNDRIVSIEGMTFASPRRLEAFLHANAGRPLPIIIDRGGQRYTVTATVPAANADSGWLGVYLEEGDDKIQGATITHVYPSGPAARAGLQTGDIILQIQDQKVEGTSDVVMVVREFQPQAQIELLIRRDQQQLKVPVVLGSRFAFQPRWNNEIQQAQYQAPYQQQQQRSQRSGDNYFDGIPPYAMQLEHQRRAAEQNERIENEIISLREEIKQLRALIEGKKDSKN